MKKLMLTICCVMAFALAGCESTPEGTQLKPDVVETLDKAAVVTESAIPALVGISPLWPPATAVVSVLSGLLIMWRKLKPQVTTAKNEAKFYAGITKALVVSIEEWKKERPGDWEYLERKLLTAIGTKAEAVIRVLRNLPITE